MTTNVNTKPLREINPQEEKVHRICGNVIPYFVDTFFARYIADYKTYLGYKGDRAKKIMKWQSNTSIPLTAAIVDTMYSSMYDSKMKFNLEGGIEGQDILLNKAFDYNNNGREVLLSVIKEAIITGKGYVKPIFNLQKEKIVINGTDYGRTKKRPELKYLSVFDVFYDYNGNLEDSTFHVERAILSKEQIYSRYISRLMPAGKELNEELVGGIKSKITNICAKTPRRYANYDFSRVKHLLSYEDLVIKRDMDTKVSGGMGQTIWNRHQSESRVNGDVGAESIDYHNNIFGVDFEANNKYEVIEYVDTNGITVMINGNMLFHKKGNDLLSKVYDISFGAIPGSSDSTGICSNIGDLQKQINTLQNVFIDGLLMDAAPMFEQVGGINQLLGKSNRMNYDPFKIIPTTQAGSLKKIELGLGGFEPANATQMLEGFAEKRVGVNEYIIGGQGKVERVSGGVDLIFNQYKSKLMPITNSVQQMMGRVAKAFLIMYAKYYSPAELKELGLKGELDIGTLINEDGLTFQLTSLALLDKEEGYKALLDNLGPILNFAGGVDAPNIDSKELLKQILTKEVDMDKLIPEDQPQQQYGQYPQPQGGGGGARPLNAMGQKQDFVQRPSLNELASQV